MTRTTAMVRERLGLGDPFAEPPSADLPLDLQGWAGTDPLLLQAIDAVRPGLGVEVGSWKGQSAVFMAEHRRARGYDSAILCIDTWLGSIEHLAREDLRPLLGLRHGRPTLYEQFHANVRARGLETWITPLPQTSQTAARYLAMRSVRADLVYLDGSHEYEDVLADLEAYWPLLRPGGLLVGDDFIPMFEGVRRACTRFAARHGLAVQVAGVKFVLRKPAAPTVPLATAPPTAVPA